MAEDIARYFAPQEYLETVFCFLLFLEMRDDPMNTHHPIVDRLVSGQPAQSVST